MSNIFKRIFKDISNFKKGNYDENGIYCDFDEKNIKKVNILIIGPKGTPYEGGFYFFTLYFSDNYPLSPPSVKFKTYGIINNNSIRFNPNLYTNGKVCLSILGTWSGPGWSVCCTLTSVLLSLQSLLNDYPIHNEPGWENISNTDDRCVSYNKLVQYSNLSITVIDMLTHTPPEFQVFIPVMIKYLIQNKEFFYNYLNENIELYPTPTQLHSVIFTMTIKRNFKELKEKLDNVFTIHKHLIEQLSNPDIPEELNETETETNINNEIVNTEPIIKVKSKRQVPNDNCNMYDFGIIKKSENNNKFYIVNKTKTGKKRWKLYVN